MRQLFFGRGISRPNPRAFISLLPFPSYFQVTSKFKLNFFVCCSAIQGLQGGFDLLTISAGGNPPSLSQFLCPGMFLLGCFFLGLPPVRDRWQQTLLPLSGGSSAPSASNPTSNPISASHPNLNFILSLIFPVPKNILGIFYQFNPKNGSVAGTSRAPGQGLQEAQGFYQFSL